MNTDRILHYITVVGKEEDMVETRDGPMTYRAWLERERQRITRKSGWPVEIVTNNATGEIALVLLRTSK